MPDHAPLSLREKLLLAMRVWVRFALVSIRVRRQPLPRLVARLTAVGRWSAAQARSLRLRLPGRWTGVFGSEATGHAA